MRRACLVGGMVLAVSLIAMSSLIAVLSHRYRRFRHLVQGGPTILIHHGKVIDKNLRKELLTIEELHSMLRRQGFHDLHKVSTAILESGGTLSVIQSNGNS